MKPPFDAQAIAFARADRALVIFSDIEMGSGGETDDFPNTAWFAALLGTYNEGHWARLPVEVIFNGDTFDLLKTPVDGSFVHLIDEQAALAKFEAVRRAHPAFFEGLGDFLRHEGAPRRAHFIVGNHDFDLLFPAVQQAIRDAVDAPAAAICFPGFALDLGDVHVEHGSQADPLFRMSPDTPFVPWAGGQVLNLPWGAVALLDVAMPLHRVLYPCDRARPLADVLAMLPEVHSFLLDRYWRYWTRDWLGAWWSASDPVKHVSWTLFRNVAWRLQSGDGSVQLDPARAERLAAHGHGLVVVGHLHRPAWQVIGTTKLLQTGCLRDEFRLHADGAIGDLLPKVYAEVLLAEGRVFHSHLVEVHADRAVSATMPASIFEVLEPIRALRGAPGDDGQAQAAQLAAESRRKRSD